MFNQAYTIIGMVVRETKKGNVGTTVYLTTEHEAYDRENSLKCLGESCRDEYLKGDLSIEFAVGDSVYLIYGKGFEGKAVLQSIFSANS